MGGRDDEEMEVFETNSTLLVFTQREHSCALLEISIVATNRAGSSNESETIYASFLSCKCYIKN